MDLIYNILVPIITSVLGGLVGGLFTFLGVKMTLAHEKQIRIEDKMEKNRESNKLIVENRPKLQVVEDNGDNVDKVDTREIFLIPYINPRLIDEKTIEFGYTDEIFSKDYWEKYEIILQNKGKRAIESFFLQLQYKSMVNVYSKTEITMWEKTWLGKYYQDTYNFMTGLQPGEKIKLIINYPKKYDKFKNIPLDVYMNDEDDNYWYQSYINFTDSKSDSEISAPDAFYMHIQEEYYKWFIYDHMYYAKDIDKSFRSLSIQGILERRKKACWNREEKQKLYVRKILNGEILLKHNYPLNH